MTDPSLDLSATELATDLTVAWLGNPNNRVSADAVPSFLQKMHATLTALAKSAIEEAPAAPVEEHVPAVTVRKSLASKDHLVSLIDGKPYKTLRRHLSGHGLSPDEYRARYGLKADYPMVAPSYSEQRRAMAKKIGLGRKPGMRKGGTPAKAPAPSAPKAPRGRPKKSS